MSSREILACPRDLTCLLPTYEVKPSVYRGHFLRNPPSSLHSNETKEAVREFPLAFLFLLQLRNCARGRNITSTGRKRTRLQNWRGAKKSVKYNQFGKAKVPGNSGHCNFSSLIEVHFREISLPLPPFSFLTPKYIANSSMVYQIKRRLSLDPPFYV